MGFRWSQDILRKVCFVGAGVSIVLIPKYWNIFTFFLGLFLGELIENIDTRIEQINHKKFTKNSVSEGGKNGK